MARLPRSFLGLWLAPLLAACGNGDSGPARVLVIDREGVPAAAKDRHLTQPAAMLRAATAEGLLAFDPEGHVIPALADRWIVTDGGLSYIFRLRDGRWPDGGAITGETARAALREALAQQAGTPLALDLAPLHEIRAMAGRVIELRLTTPMPDLLILLAQPELGLTHRGKGEGPMAATRDGDLTRLTMIPPGKRGLPVIDNWRATVRPLTFAVRPGAQAVAAFTAGLADVVTGGGFAELPLVQRTTFGNQALRIDQVAGLFGLLVVRADGFLATAANREALAMAIDRDSLATALGTAGWAPTTRIVTPGLAGDAGVVGERWGDLALDGRQTLAARQVNRWIVGGNPPVVLHVAIPAGPGGDILFERLAGDLQAIGITLRRAGADEVPDLRVIDAVARYPRPEWFLDRLSCKALKGPCSADADTLAASARASTDPRQAALLRAQAENTLADSNVFIPFGPPIRWSLVRGATAGFAANRLGFHPLPPLAMRPVTP